MAASTHFDLLSHWCIQAPVERVWTVLNEPSSWPLWWPHVRRVRTLQEGDADGVGAVLRIDWSTRLPYSLSLDMQVVESVRNQLLRGRARGHLEGEGLWLLRDRSGATSVTYVWRVALKQRWMRWLAPVLAPVFRWSHAGVMRAGEAGLRRYLAQGGSGAPPAR